jgi:alkylation response protein AidB-like acyl-CoA dehydrogenase
MMDKAQETQDSGAIDWVARAKALAPIIAEAADRIEAERRVPPDIMAAMHDAELFRMCLPRSLGGGEADPLTVMQTTEAIASADASTGWCLSQGLGCSRSSAYLDHDVAQEIFGPPDAILAWGPPEGTVKAVVVDGGYRVTGKWRFASGIMNATWLGSHCPIFERDGSPRLDATGKPAIRTLMMPASSATITDVWHVIGLKGTGSNSFSVDDVFVRDAYTIVRDSAAHRREKGRLYGILMTTFYGMSFAGVALGIARTALDDFITLAGEKKPTHASQILRENPAVQRQLALAEANLGAARAYLVDRIRTVWDSAEPPDSWPVDQRARLRLACTHAIMQARDTVAYVYQAAGSGAVLAKNPFERRFRDINAVANQAQGQPTNLEQAGMALLGGEQIGSRI